MFAVVALHTRAARRLLERSQSDDAAIEAQVRAIIEDVRQRGDNAVKDYTRQFDNRVPTAGSYEIGAEAWRARAAETAPSIREALAFAAARIRAFHERQRVPDVVDEQGGIRLTLRGQSLARVGLYVPGGTARYPSSVLMTAVPAQVAGVAEIIMVTPGASAETLCAAELAGVTRVFEIGGAQAVAALAYGTQTVPRVDKIVGPGNQWVAAAKRQVFGAVDIDSIAGPSEVLILADDSANPAWIAADLLAQAEHDREARAVLVTTSQTLAEAVAREVAVQCAQLPRAEIAETALRAHGAAVVAPSLEAAIEYCNAFAPEHLELHVAEARAVAERCTTAGAIFVGPHASEAAGDYLAGANHVLPTGGAGRYASPLGVYDFRKWTSLVEYTAAAAAADAPRIAALAEVEGLAAHGRAAMARAEVVRDAD